MNKYTKVEKEQNFVPLGSDYSRFVAMQEAKRIKRIPEVGAKMPSGKKEGIGKSVSDEKPEVKRLEERMRQSLGTSETKPKAVAPKKPTQAASSGGGGDTDIFRKLHGTSFDPKSKRDQKLMGYIRGAAKEAGGYGDFKAVRNLAYSQQYGPSSAYGKMATKWRGSR